MGLDMYLFKIKKGDERFIKDNKQQNNSDYWFFHFLLTSDYEAATTDERMPFKVELPQKRGDKKGYELVGYLRKVNSIHNWFVNNVQGGIDDNLWHKVSKQNFLDLLETCNTVLNSCKLPPSAVLTTDNYYRQAITNQAIAKKLLPTKDGNFFGSLEYDGMYLRDLQVTVKIIEDILNTVDFDKYTVFYNSWA